MSRRYKSNMLAKTSYDWRYIKRVLYKSRRYLKRADNITLVKINSSTACPMFTIANVLYAGIKYERKKS